MHADIQRSVEVVGGETWTASPPACAESRWVLEKGPVVMGQAAATKAAAASEKEAAVGKAEEDSTADKAAAKMAAEKTAAEKAVAEKAAATSPLAEIDVASVACLLQNIGLAPLVDKLADCDREILSQLTDSDLREMGVSVPPHRRKLLEKVKEFETQGVLLDLLAARLPPVPLVPGGGLPPFLRQVSPADSKDSQRKSNRWGLGADAPAAGACDFFPVGWTPSKSAVEAIQCFQGAFSPMRFVFSSSQAR